MLLAIASCVSLGKFITILSFCFLICEIEIVTKIPFRAVVRMQRDTLYKVLAHVGCYVFLSKVQHGIVKMPRHCFKHWCHILLAV